jgi:hypothetical protein
VTLGWVSEGASRDLILADSGVAPCRGNPRPGVGVLPAVRSRSTTGRPSSWAATSSAKMARRRSSGGSVGVSWAVNSVSSFGLSVTSPDPPLWPRESRGVITRGTPAPRHFLSDVRETPSGWARSVVGPSVEGRPARQCTPSIASLRSPVTERGRELGSRGGRARHRLSMARRRQPSSRRDGATAAKCSERPPAPGGGWRAAGERMGRAAVGGPPRAPIPFARSG